MSPRQLLIPFQPFYMQNFDKDADRVGRKFAEASQAGLEVSKRYNVFSQHLFMLFKNEFLINVQ